MLRLRNKLTKEHKRFHTQYQAADFLRCSQAQVSLLHLGKLAEIRNWTINNYPATKPRRKPV